MIEMPDASSTGNRMTTKHFADRHGRRLGSFEKLRCLGDTRADVKTDRANQQAEDIRDAPSPIDQLLVREQRRQGEAEE